MNKAEFGEPGGDSGLQGELRRIEAVLRRLARVSESAVIEDVDRPGESRIFVCVVPTHAELEGLPAGKRWQSPNGLQMAVQSRGEAAYFYEEIFERGCYLADGAPLEDLEVVFDVGANIGMFTLFVASRCPRARIYAVEPAPLLIEHYERNVRIHGVGAELFSCALAARPGTEVLTFYPHSSGMSSLVADFQEESEILVRHIEVARSRGQQGIESLMDRLPEYLASRLTGLKTPVQVRTLSALLDETGEDRVDLLKVDVQKSELKVLEGIHEEHWPVIRRIVLEVHDLHGRLEAVCSLLASHGYTVTVDQDEVLEGTVLRTVHAYREGAGSAEVLYPVAEPVASLASQPVPVANDSLARELRSCILSQLPKSGALWNLVLLDRLPRTPDGDVDQGWLLRFTRERDL
ncbi:MAG: FkbM family methyltransferase [bacterium]